MRKLFIALFVAALALTGVTTASASAPASVPYTTVYAPLSVSLGNHNTTLYSDTVDGRRARAKIYYNVSDSLGWLTWELTGVTYETDWNSHPAFLGNAFRVDLEANPDFYVEASPAWGGSSTTLDDMPSYYAHSYSDQPLRTFQNTDTPAIRARFYGVGAGAIENRSDDYAAIE